MNEYSRYNVNSDEFITQQELAKRLGVSISKLKQIKSNPANNFPKPINFDGPNRYSVQEINAWLTRRREGNRPEIDTNELSAQLAAVIGNRKSSAKGAKS